MYKRPKIQFARGRKVSHEYQPSSGVKTDFEALLQRFSSFGTVRYEKFAECWKEMKMSCYCAGRQTQKEVREFVENCFLIASQYWLPPSSFLIRAGALYLLYGLYYFQLVMPKVKIRITHQQWLKILEFQQEAREQKHHDLDFVFHKLLSEKAFVFVATEEDMYAHQKDDADSRIIPDSMKDDTGLLDEVFSNSAISQLSLVHSQYQKMKSVLNNNETGEPDTSLNIVHADLIDSINKTLETHKERQKIIAKKLAQNPSLSMDEEIEGTEMEHGESVSLKKFLKQKAFEQGISGKKKKTTAEEEEKTWHIDLSQKVTQSQGHRLVGNKNIVGLFDRDENEDAPVKVPPVHELFCMPDLDDAHKSYTQSAGSSSKETDENTEENTDGKDSDADDKESSGEVAEEPSGNSKRKAKSQQEKYDTKKSKCKKMKMDDAAKKSDTSLGTSEAELNHKNAEFQSKAKVVTDKSGKGKKKTEVSAGECSPCESESKEEQVKEITAQEKLLMKLNKKKKEARLKIAKKRKSHT